MQIQVVIRSVYGTEKIYPVCDKAATFAGMLKQTTLTRENVESIKRLGFEVIAVAAHTLGAL